VKVVHTQRFLRSYRKAPEMRRRQFQKQLKFLLSDPRHPSLRAKIVDEGKRVWQARVDGGWRFYFQIRENTVYLLDITSHP
jgi:mRNA-degrading endonuclease RelE of RelBE toxin-antitoxin system